MKMLIAAIAIIIGTQSFAATSCYKFESPKAIKESSFQWITIPTLSGKSQSIDITVKSGRSIYDGTFYCTESIPRSYRCQGDDDGGDFSIVLGGDSPILVLKYINVGELDQASVHISSKVPLSVKGTMSKCK